MARLVFHDGIPWYWPSNAPAVLLQYRYRYVHVYYRYSSTWYCNTMEYCSLTPSTVPWHGHVGTWAGRPKKKTEQTLSRFCVCRCVIFVFVFLFVFRSTLIVFCNTSHSNRPSVVGGADRPSSESIFVFVAKVRPRCRRRSEKQGAPKCLVVPTRPVLLEVVDSIS